MTKQQVDFTTTIESKTEYGPVEVSLFALGPEHDRRHILHIEQQDGVNDDGDPRIDIVTIRMEMADELVETIQGYQKVLAEIVAK